METKARILIVDDDEYVRNTYAQCLVKNHYDVAEAEDWRTAFEKVQEFDPQVVLLDIKMPEISGNRLVETLRSWKAGVEVIMISALVSDKTRDECLADGAYAVLLKPIGLNELTQAIEGALARRAAEGTPVGRMERL